MKVFGLIGRSLEHSFSKDYFNNKFKIGGLDAIYENFEFEKIEEIRPFFEGRGDVVGLNVTIPYKEEIIPYLDEIEESAKEIGAVNTILIQNNKWKGFNTDQYGFMTSLKPFLTNMHERALILGDGGASRAIRYALSKRSIPCHVVSRENGKADLTYDELNNYVFEACKLIINTTPLGMYPNLDSFPVIPFEFIGKEHLVYDLVYNPEKTQFLTKAEERGASIMNGLDMLKLQAEMAWEIWNTH